MRTLAAASGAPCFHSGMNSHFGSSFETSSEIGNGCASSLPASTRHGVWQLETNARSDAVDEARTVQVLVERVQHRSSGLGMVA